MRQAVIMAGGKGTRLLPYTETIPKPLLPIGGVSILAILLAQLRRHGIEAVTLAIGHEAGQIRTAVGDGAAFGLAASYVEEHEPLGTAGALHRIMDRLDDDFILANGDLLTDLDFSAMMRAHVEAKADATVGAFRLAERSPYGVLTVEPSGRISDYVEKPVQAFDVSMGIYCLRRDAVGAHLGGGRSDMPDLILRMIAAGRRVQAYREANLWMDIGTPSDYARASDRLAADPGLLDRRDRHSLDVHATR